MLYYYNLMKKYILSIITVLFVTNCANLEFLYKDNKWVNELKNNTNLVISGDEAEEVYSYIVEILESSNGKSPNYKLSINSTRIDKALVIEKDATALKFSIEENTIKAFSAGCNIVLHCNGKMKEMEIVAKTVPKVDNFILKKTSQFYNFLM